MLLGREFIETICKAMGIDSKNVKTIGINADWEEELNIVITFYATGTLLRVFSNIKVENKQEK